MQSSIWLTSKVQDRLRKVREVVATGHAFAALTEDGDVVTWGHIVSGGESISIRDKLHAVQQISSSMHAFAAVRRDGTVVTGGEAESGGDSSKVKDQLQRVKQAGRKNVVHISEIWAPKWCRKRS